MPVTVMRSPLLHCLIVVLSLALANGNAYAALHLGDADSEPGPHEHAHHRETTPHQHQHQHDKGLACCCDCLGCSSVAYLAPELSVIPAALGAKIRFYAASAFFSGRTLVPEPDPPRRSAVS